MKRLFIKELYTKHVSKHDLITISDLTMLLVIHGKSNVSICISNQLGSIWLKKGFNNISNKSVQ